MVSKKMMDAVTIVKQGHECYKKGEYTKALEFYKQALALAPKRVEPCSFIAMTYFRLRDYDKAWEYAVKTRDINPNYYGGYNWMGLVAEHRDKDYKRAVELYNRAITRSPNNWALYGNRGRAYHKWGKDDEASADLDKASAMKKISADWHGRNMMPKNPTVDQRIRWHQEHQKHCGCRPIPKKLLDEMRKKKAGH